MLIFIIGKGCDDLGPDKFAKVSCNGLWHFLGTENGHAVVQKWRDDLGPDKFASLSNSNSSFWSFLATTGGETRARDWQGTRVSAFFLRCVLQFAAHTVCSFDVWTKGAFLEAETARGG